MAGKLTPKYEKEFALRHIDYPDPYGHQWVILGTESPIAERLHHGKDGGPRLYGAVDLCVNV